MIPDEKRQTGVLPINTNVLSRTPFEKLIYEVTTYKNQLFKHALMRRISINFQTSILKDQGLSKT
jgi:hypothetical protein